MNHRVIYLFVITLISCASAPFPVASELHAPIPIIGSKGKYMCPYTQDYTVAAWVDKGMNAKAGASIGGAAGAYMGQKVLENLPFVGGVVGNTVGKKIGREIALKGAGGEEYLRKTSDLSFDNLNDLSVYIYVVHSSDENYQEVLDLTMEIYPELKNSYFNAIRTAPKAKTTFVRYQESWRKGSLSDDVSSPTGSFGDGELGSLTESGKSI